MEWNNWGKKLARIFSGAGNGTSDPLGFPMARRFSVRELDDIIDCLQNLKDVTQTSTLAMDSILKAVPNEKIPGAADVCAAGRNGLRQPLEQGRDMLGNYLLWKEQMTAERRNAVKQDRDARQDENLSVTDCDREFMIGVATSGREALAITRAAARVVKELEPYAAIPQIARIKAEFQENEPKISALFTNLIRLTGGVAKRTPDVIVPPML